MDTEGSSLAYLNNAADTLSNNTKEAGEVVLFTSSYILMTL
jgi:hypothetical protein